MRQSNSSSSTSSAPRPPRAVPARQQHSSTSAASSGGTLTLGTKNFTEEFIVGPALQAGAHRRRLQDRLQGEIGATEVVDKALTSGQIDAYPEYTGESVATVFGLNQAVTSPQQEYNLAKQAYAKRGQVMSDMTPFFDTDAIAVNKAYAQKYGLVTTADLKKVPHFTLGARPEFLNREEGARA